VRKVREPANNIQRLKYDNMERVDRGPNRIMKLLSKVVGTNFHFIPAQARALHFKDKLGSQQRIPIRFAQLVSLPNQLAKKVLISRRFPTFSHGQLTTALKYSKTSHAYAEDMLPVVLDLV